MPSTRKQKAREKRSRQSDVMSHLENLDIMLCNFSKNDFERQDFVGELDADLESEGLLRETSQAGEILRSLLNTNTSVNSVVPAETSRAIFQKFLPKCLESYKKSKWI